MKIAVPVSNGKLSMHFGHCEEFALVTVDAESKSISGVETLTAPPHEPGVLPRWLGEKGADVIIAGGMGQRAQVLFAEQDIKVVVGAEAKSAEDLVNDYLNGNLQSGANLCDH